MHNIALFFKALADETRLALLWLLLNQKEICVCDLMAILGMTQSKISRHLAVLRHAGLVCDRKEGTWSYYSMRTIENQLEQNQIDSLRITLGAHPSATRILRDLEALKKRGSHERCGNEVLTGSSLPGKSSSRGSAASKGLNR